MKLIAIVDSVGRVILGRHDQAGSNKNVTNLKNPAVVNIQVNQESGQISVQLIPYIFREFVSESQRDEGVTWSFQKNNITTSPDLALEDSIVEQYARIFETPTEAATPVEDAEVEPVELFDDESTDSEQTSK